MEQIEQVRLAMYTKASEEEVKVAIAKVLLFSGESNSLKRMIEGFGYKEDIIKESWTVAFKIIGE